MMTGSTFLWVGLLLVGLCFLNLGKGRCRYTNAEAGRQKRGSLTPSEISLVKFSETRNSSVKESRLDLDPPKSDPGRTSDSAFDWNDMQAAENVTGMCGFDKCFWRSTSDPESVGYLVASAGWHYRSMKKAYKFAVDVLEEKCRAKHLLLAAPKRVKVTLDIPQKLNSLKHNDQAEFDDRKGLPMKYRKKPRSEHRVFNEHDDYLVVQKVKVMPEPNLMFAARPNKWEKLVEDDIPRFRSELQDRGVSLRLVQENLESERKRIKCAMQYGETYWHDLQGLIDLEGNYFHFDLDSQFWRKIGSKTAKSESGVVMVTQKTAHQERQDRIDKFNEMIQQLVDPPKDDVSE